MESAVPYDHTIIADAIFTVCRDSKDHLSSLPHTDNPNTEEDYPNQNQWGST
jgi:hypothetical protein